MLSGSRPLPGIFPVFLLQSMDLVVLVDRLSCHSSWQLVPLVVQQNFIFPLVGSKFKVKEVPEGFVSFIYSDGYPCGSQYTFLYV